MLEQGEKNPLVTLINTARLVLVFLILCLIQLVDGNIVALETLGIVAGLYAVALSALPFDRTRSKHLGYLICLLDAALICGLITWTGEINSPFLAVLFFPLISLSILYETKGAFAAALIFLLYSSLHFLTAPVWRYTPAAILNLFVTMSLLSFFAVYLGNVGKSIKARGELKALREEVERLRAKQGA